MPLVLFSRFLFYVLCLVTFFSSVCIFPTTADGLRHSKTDIFISVVRVHHVKIFNASLQHSKSPLCTRVFLPSLSWNSSHARGATLSIHTPQGPSASSPSYFSFFFRVRTFLLQWRCSAQSYTNKCQEGNTNIGMGPLPPCQSAPFACQNNINNLKKGTLT